MRHYVIDCDGPEPVRLIAACKLHVAVRIADRLGGDVVGYIRNEPDESEIAREVQKELAWAARK